MSLKPIKITTTWTEAWRQNNFRLQLLITLFCLIVILTIIPQFFLFIQNRNGFVINDWLLILLYPKDFSIYIFTFIYSSIIIALFSLLQQPINFLRLLQAYIFLTCLRILCILFVPLNAPSGYIDLVDPIIGQIAYGGNYIDKDLFFSGHVSVLFLLFLFESNRFLKIAFLSSTILVAILLLVQHVHYTIDVIAALIFAWFSQRIILFLFDIKN